MAKNVAVATANTSKKAKSAKPKMSKTSTQHPKVSEMVNAAILTLKERGGSSVQAIKKYIVSHYKVNIDKLSPFIKRYLKSSVISGILIQTKGRGASGSFKMASQTKEKSPKPISVASKAKKAAKPVAAKEAAKPVVLKAKKTAKPVAAKKPVNPKIPKKASVTKKLKTKTTKSPKKAKPTKPKSPKIKSIAGAKIMKIGHYNKAPSMKTQM